MKSIEKVKDTLEKTFLKCSFDFFKILDFIFVNALRLEKKKKVLGKFNFILQDQRGLHDKTSILTIVWTYVNGLCRMALMS